MLGALYVSGARAQAAPPAALPAPSPPSAPADTTGADTSKVKKDTVQARFAQAPMPAVLEVGESFTWDRAALFNTGMLTLYDVLDRVPGLTVYRSGWFPSPQYAAYLGNPARLRVFWDGVEMFGVGNSTSYPLDLAAVPMWAVQEMTLERGADEVRIYLRSWNVDRTTTQSRIDIVTGDLGTNALRAFFGRRFSDGVGVQFGGQVYGTTNDVTIGSGTGSDLLLRVGWAHGAWSLDGFLQRTNGTQDPQVATTSGLPRDPYLSAGIPGETGNRSNGYIRLGVGQPDSSGWWAQVIGDQQTVSQLLLPSLSTGYTPVDSLTAHQTVTQVIAAGGLTAGKFRLSASERMRWLPAGENNEVTARASLDARVLSLSAFADYQQDSGSIAEGAIKFSPVPFIALAGAAGYRTAPAGAGGSGASGRLTAGVRLGRVWITGGAIQRADAMVPGLVRYDTAYKSALTAQASGPFFAIQGKVVDDVGINVWAIRWNAPGFYRPQLQSRAEVFLDTQWLSKFPSGHFGLHAAFGHAYRSDVLFPTKILSEAFALNPVVAYNSNVVFANIEVRVLDATVYYTGNWAVTPRPYELVPRFLQPNQVFTYGMRWSFWN